MFNTWNHLINTYFFSQIIFYMARCTFDLANWKLNLTNANYLELEKRSTKRALCTKYLVRIEMNLKICMKFGYLEIWAINSALELVCNLKLEQHNTKMLETELLEKEICLKSGNLEHGYLLQSWMIKNIYISNDIVVQINDKFDADKCLNHSGPNSGSNNYVLIFWMKLFCFICTSLSPIRLCIPSGVVMGWAGWAATHPRISIK